VESLFLFLDIFLGELGLTSSSLLDAGTYRARFSFCEGSAAVQSFCGLWLMIKRQFIKINTLISNELACGIKKDLDVMKLGLDSHFFELDALIALSELVLNGLLVSLIKLNLAIAI
jgi:hypothetical protein